MAIKSNEPPKNTPIAARPGTAEYESQFHRQALAAADSALRLGIVRAACGFFGLLFLAGGIVEVAEGTCDWDSFAFLLRAIITVDLLNVALRGKSMWFRLLLSGVRRPETGTNKQPGNDD